VCAEERARERESVCLRVCCISGATLACCTTAVFCSVLQCVAVCCSVLHSRYHPHVSFRCQQTTTKHMYAEGRPQHMYANACTYICIHAHARTRTHTRTFTRTHFHTHIQTQEKQIHNDRIVICDYSKIGTYTAKEDNLETTHNFRIVACYRRKFGEMVHAQACCGCGVAKLSLD